MKFRTEYLPHKSEISIDPLKPVLLMGSCFADNIGAKIRECMDNVFVNPCGVIYNPSSIALLVQLALTQRVHRRTIVEASVTKREGKYVSWFMDSKTAAESAEKCVDKVCERLDILQKALETADTFIVTFGTPDAWLIKGTDRVVGNCHKHPAAEFEKIRLGIEDISMTWTAIVKGLRELNPHLNVIFTVSPRRYLGEGFADNSRLKSILLLACEKICNELKDAVYFPAYEILIDDLRDYRFYNTDLLHPSPAGIDYIWEKFTETFFTKEDIRRLKEARTRYVASLHRKIVDTD